MNFRNFALSSDSLPAGGAIVRLRRRTALTRLIVLTTSLGIAGGCSYTTERVDKSKKDYGVAPIQTELSKSSAYRDTIGSLAYFEGLAPMRVRGYGLVVGLGKNGSTDCPKQVYDRLVQNLYKHHRFSSTVVGIKDITPEKMLADADTAVVIVQGEIPPAAIEGSRFDVTVMALPGTSTKSLRGGRLYSADLELFRANPSGVAIIGQVMAQAAGPIFLNPFSDAESATKSNPLEGSVIGGGVLNKPRRLRLVLGEPSYPIARRIQDRINTQFSPAKVADAISPSFIQIHIPPEYRNETGHFLALVRGLYLTKESQFNAVRARELASEIVNPSAPHAMITACFEGIGRDALPVLADLYAHSKDYVSFYATVAGARLDDPLAYDALIYHASREQSEFRFQAIRALGESKVGGSPAAALRKLLLDSDSRVQVAAYEALLRQNDATIQSKMIGGDSFRLDAVPEAQSGFVYAKRSTSRRIALFGKDLQCTPPILYRSPDGSVTLNAPSDANDLTVMRTAVSTGATSPQFHVSFDVTGLISLMGADPGVDAAGKPTGLGLDYGAVVRAIHSLCEDHAINARFILEQPNATELFGPPRPVTRPESEL